MKINSRKKNFIFIISQIVIFFNLNKQFKEELFKDLANWIIHDQQKYPSFGECKLWIKKRNSKYVISKNDEKKILILLTYLPRYQ